MLMILLSCWFNFLLSSHGGEGTHDEFEGNVGNVTGRHGFSDSNNNPWQIHQEIPSKSSNINQPKKHQVVRSSCCIHIAQEKRGGKELWIEFLNKHHNHMFALFDCLHVFHCIFVEDCRSKCTPVTSMFKNLIPYRCSHYTRYFLSCLKIQLSLQWARWCKDLQARFGEHVPEIAAQYLPEFTTALDVEMVVSFSG